MLEGNLVNFLEPVLLTALDSKFNFDFAAAIEDDNDDNRADSNDFDVAKLFISLVFDVSQFEISHTLSSLVLSFLLNIREFFASLSTLANIGLVNCLELPTEGFNKGIVCLFFSYELLFS